MNSTRKAQADPVRLRIQSPNPDSHDFQNLIKTFLSRDQRYIFDKTCVNISRSFIKIWAKCVWKNALLCNVEEAFRKFLDPDSDTDDFQNL